MLTVGGRGHESLDGGLPGDLDLIVNILVHDGWKAKGADIIKTLKLSYGNALLGGDVEVSMPFNKSLNVRIPAYSNTGRKIRLAGMGLVNGDTGEKGDAVLIIAIVLPPKRKLPDAIEMLIRDWKL